MGTGLTQSEQPAQKADQKEPSLEVARIPDPPRGWGRVKELGPGFLWMVSAAGSGELLFTPRVSAQYGYALLWALLAAVTLKWFINREVGRYAVCSGASVIEGFKTLPGPRNWALWLILVPQIVVAAASMAGMASSAATALILVLPGDARVWMIISISVSAALVLWGRYKSVESVARVLAVALALAGITAAISVLPGLRDLAAGLVPQLPDRVNYGEILPWLGYMLSGAAGLVWYSYWVPAKGYGAARLATSQQGPVATKELGREDQERLRGWLRQMTLDTSVAVVGALIITVSFLILGAELLLPRGLLPEENRVAETLGHLLGGVWGPVGFWLMIVGVFIGFWDTVLSDQDGFGRMFANGTRLLLRPFGVTGRWADERFLKKIFVVVLVTLLPIALYLIEGEPVALLKIAGAIEAAHIPVVTGLVLYLNHRTLPPALRPSMPVLVVTVLAGLFFTAFTMLYLYWLGSGAG